MGDPKSQRRKYSKPTHPWQGDRIEAEDEYVRKYGLKNKREFWKAESFLRDQRAQARSYLPLVLRDDPQGKKEADQLVGKLNRLGVLDSDASLDDVLALDVDAILSRRLQTITFLKGLANTPNQARQFIVHGHVAIDGRRVTVPGYLVKRTEEQNIEYAPTSPLQNPAHPLRQGDAYEGPSPEPEVEPEEEEEPAEPAQDEEADEEEPEAEESEEEASDEEEPEEEEPAEPAEDEEAGEEEADEEEASDEEESEEEEEPPEAAEEAEESSSDEADQAEADEAEAEEDEASASGEEDEAPASEEEEDQA